MKIDKIIITIFINILILLTIPVISKAAGTFSATISKTTVKEGDTFTVTATATKVVGEYTITASNSNAVAVNIPEESFLDGYSNSDSQTWTFKANKAGTVTITAKPIDMSDTDEVAITNSKTFVVTIDSKNTSAGSSNSGTSNNSASSSNSSNTSNNNSSSSTSVNNNTTETNSTTTKQPIKPTFTSTNKTVYTTGEANLRSSWSTSSTATSVEKGTELTLTGTSTQTINGYVWYRVEYKGSTKYIANFLISSTKPKEEPKEKSDNNNLSSLEIEGITLIPKFSKDILQYRANIDLETTELDIIAKADDTKSKVAIEGNKELKEGESTIKIIVTAEDNTTKTYTVKVKKVKEEESVEINSTDETLKLYQLQIGGVDFEAGFDPDIYSYELTLNIAVNNLAITAKANQEDAKIEIVGNENFVEGQNIVMILLTSADGTESATYQIKVNMPATAKETQNNLQFYLMCAGVAISVILLIIIIVSICKRKDRDDEFLDEKEELELDNDTKKREELRNRNSEKEAILNYSELEKKTKRSKGKHSV